MGRSPWGYKESDTTERLSTHNPQLIWEVTLGSTVEAGEVREEKKVASSLQLAPRRLQLPLHKDARNQWRTLWNGYPSHGAFRHQLLCLWDGRLESGS